MSAREKAPSGRSKTLKKVLKVIAGHKALACAGVALSALTVALQLYVPVLFGQAVDGIVGPGRVDMPFVLSRLALIVVVVAASAAMMWVMSVVNNRLSYGAVRDLRAQAIRAIQRLPLKWLDGHSAGDVVQRVIADTDQLSEGLLLGFSQLFGGVVTIVMTLVYMFSRDVVITLMVLALTPVSFLVARFIASRSYDLFQKQTRTRGQLTGLINELVSGAKVVRAFGYEDRASARFARLNDELEDDARKAVFYSSLTNPSTRAVNNVIYALVALVGALRAIAGGMSVGALTVLLSYASQYMKPFNDISGVVTELQNALACAARLFELIEAEPEPAEAPAQLGPVQGHARLSGVAFSYDPAVPLIEGLELDARPGMKIAIVGPTGCGKTTLINLLMRFYDVDAGSITLDGADIRGVTRHSLRRSYGMVLQETWLCGGTVRDNIAFGKPDATDDEIIQAAKEAHSWEFIRRMPKGLDTPVTENSLSAGQKQLLCITRVMLLRPPMLILDEATSSIDTRTEQHIQQAFDRLMSGRTSFVVAHRLSTIRQADLILVMRAGRVIEQGTHDQLIARGGFYASLYAAQYQPAEA